MTPVYIFIYKKQLIVQDMVIFELLLGFSK